MFEITGAAVTLTAIIILYRSRQSLARQRDILIKELNTAAKLNTQLNRIVSVHGCAPTELTSEGTEHYCEKCRTTWEAQPVQITWLDSGLKNRMRQSWQLTSQE